MSQTLVFICLASIIRLLGYDGNALKWERYFAIPLTCMIMMYHPSIYITRGTDDVSLLTSLVLILVSCVIFIFRGRFEYLRRFINELSVR